MKKFFAGLLLVVCLLTACGKETKPKVMTEDSQLAVTTTTATENLTESVETEYRSTEEPSTTEMETSEIATEATTVPTTSPTEVTATMEAATKKETQPTTAPTEAATPSTTSPSTTTPPVTTTPTETQPYETESPATQPIYEVIDTAALEAYGRAYAETLGYDGNPTTGFATNAGYFPPSLMRIRTMEEGYRRVKELVDAQYADDVGAGHAIVVVIDGVERHRKLNIYLQPTDDPNMFLMYCFYGGE